MFLNQVDQSELFKSQPKQQIRAAIDFAVATGDQQMQKVLEKFVKGQNIELTASLSSIVDNGAANLSESDDPATIFRVRILARHLMNLFRSKPKKTARRFFKKEA